MDGLYEVSSSYAALQEAMQGDGMESRILFAKEQVEHSFLLAPYQSRLSEALGEVDGAKLNELFHEIADAYDEKGPGLLSTISATSLLVSMVFTMVPDGQALVEEIFHKKGERYQNLYRMHSAHACAQYLRSFGDGMEEGLSTRRQDWRATVVQRVQSYIKANLDKRLSLSEVASLFGFSQNYLSTLFSRYANIGYVEYTTDRKMEKAKALMATGSWKIYELARQLGYEDSSYFSKVFKQHEGMSPREYAQSRGGLVDES